MTKKGLKMEIPEFVPLSQKTKKASMEETKRKEKERIEGLPKKEENYFRRFPFEPDFLKSRWIEMKLFLNMRAIISKSGK